MISIDYKDARPIYEQIVDRFQLLILKGVLEPDSKMPSVRSLAMELSINPNTIQKAYDRLEQNGFLYTVKGKGCFVRFNDSLIAIRKQELLGKMSALCKEASDIGISPSELISVIKQTGGEHS